MICRMFFYRKVNFMEIEEAQALYESLGFEGSLTALLREKRLKV